MKYLVLICVLVLSNCAHSEETGVFFNVGVGTTRLGIDSNMQGQAEVIDPMSLGFGIGYLFSNHIQVQAEKYGSNRLWLLGTVDDYSLWRYDFFLGYRLGRKQFRFTPKFGVSRWKLEWEEGQLFHPGPEAVIRQYGTDFIWGVDLGYKFDNNLEWVISHKRSHTKFGDFRDLNLELSVRL